jgi:hypothetical protein
MGIELPSQEFGKIIIGTRAYDVVRSPPSYNIEMLNTAVHETGEPMRSLRDSVRVYMVRGTRPDISARVGEISELIRMWIVQSEMAIDVSEDEILAGLREVLPDSPKITRVRDKPTGQMVDVVKGAMILMEHEKASGGVIRMRY